jgi:plasmid stabilization system protein ParE
MNIVMQPPALADVDEIHDYYRLIRAELGSQFLHQFRRAIDRMLIFPRGWRKLDDEYRCCQLRQFPYGIYYRVDDPQQQIVVVAVLHLHRDPNAWRRRRP